MLSQTIQQVIRFADDPNNRTVTAFFQDGSSVIIEQISHENYTNPPGYKEKNGDIELYRTLFQERKIKYYTALSSQLNS